MTDSTMQAVEGLTDVGSSSAAAGTTTTTASIVSTTDAQISTMIEEMSAFLEPAHLEQASEQMEYVVQTAGGDVHANTIPTIGGKRTKHE